MQGFTQALFASTVFHLILSLKCSWGDWGHCKLWLKPLKMAIFSGCYIWCSSCIITSNIQDFPILRFHVYTPTIFLLTNLLFKNMKCFQLKKNSDFYNYMQEMQHKGQWKTDRNKTLWHLKRLNWHLKRPSCQWNTIFKNNNNKKWHFFHIS